MNATDIITTANQLPKIADVTASTMLTAQTYTPTAAERAAIVARADFFERLGMTRTVNVKVVDFGGAHIGNLAFHI